MDPTRRSPTLPPELISPILVEAMLMHLADGNQDKAATLCLISKDYLSLTQAQLYHQPVLKPLDVQVNSVLHRTLGIGTLIDTLQGSPTLSHLVRGVTLHCATVNPGKTALRDALERTLSLCPDLDRLAVAGGHSFDWAASLVDFMRGPEDASTPRPIARFKSLAGGTALVDGLFLSHVLGAASHLENLTYRPITTVPVTRFPLDFSPSLRHLRINAAESHKAVIVFDLYASSSLQSFDVGISEDPKDQFESPALQSLQTLRLDLREYGDQRATFRTDNLKRLLKRCTSLKHLALYAQDLSTHPLVVNRLSQHDVLADLPTTLLTLDILTLPLSFEDVLPVLSGSTPRLRRMYWRRDHLNDNERHKVEQLCEMSGIELYSEVSVFVDEL